MTAPFALDPSPPCCCLSPNARRCYEIRYPAPIDDLERADYFARLQEDGDECECGCHEPEEYPEDPDDYGETIWDVP